MINKKRKPTKLLYYAAVLFIPVVLYGGIVLAILMDLKLPFPKDEKLFLTQGYHGDGWKNASTTPTHASASRIDDHFALDFTKSGCASYDKPVLAIADGTVEKAETGHEYAEKNSYGNQILIYHPAGDVYSRYGHLNQVFVKRGDSVKQGRTIGTVGNTGNVDGAACLIHPGTHLHFAVYKGKIKNGIFTVTQSLKPEPMSGYGEGAPKGPFKANEWYTSDNELFEPNKVLNGPPAAAQPTSRPSFVIRVISWLGEVAVA